MERAQKLRFENAERVLWRV